MSLNLRGYALTVKRFLALLLSVMVVATCIPVSITVGANDGNLLANPGFEAGSNGWDLNAKSFTVTDEEAYAGNQSLKVFTNAEGEPYQNAIQWGITVTPNTEYKISLYAKGNAPFQVVKSWQGINMNITPTADWTRYDATFNSGNLDKIDLIIQNTEKSDKVTYIDEVYLTAVSSEETSTEDIILNGKYEFGDQPWAGVSSNYAIVDIVSHSAVRSAKLTPTADWPGIEQWLSKEQIAKLSADSEYVLRAWIKLDDNVTNAVSFDGYIIDHVSWQQTKLGTVTVNPGEWTELTGKGTVTEDLRSKGFSVRIIQANELANAKVFYVDDVSFTKAATVTKTITSLTNTTARTKVGTAPTLPATVVANYSDNSRSNLAVKWGAVDERQYAAEGAFDVEGSVEGTDLMVKCTVTVTAANVEAKEYYMSEDGSDSNTGTIDAPFATVAHFDAIAKPGDTLYIREGFYEQSTDITCTGTEEAWITIRNYPGEVPVFDGSSWKGFEDQDIRFAAFFGNAGSHHVIIQGLIMQNYRMSGITGGYREKDDNGNYVGEPLHDYIIRYNLVDRSGQNGISFGSGAYNITYEYNLVGRTGYDMTFGSWSSGLNFLDLDGTENYVRGNISYHNIDVSARHTDGNGMILDTSGEDTAVTVENNLFFLNGGVGIAWTDASNATIRNNTLYENGQDPDYINGPTGMAFWEANHNIDITNNIVYQRNKNGLQTNKPFDRESVVESNNIAGDLAHDPKFKDPLNADFTLADNSPDIDRGYESKGPADALSFDNKVLKRQTEGQPVDWYTFAPDFVYIKEKGGLENCITKVERKAENGRVDLGAFTTDLTNPEPDKVIAYDVPPPPPPPVKELLTNQGFETGTTGWSALVSTINAVNSIQISQSGYQCLEVSGRTAFWNGIYQSITPKIQNDKTYDVSGYFKLPEGAAATSKKLAIYVKIVMESDPKNAEGDKDGNTYTIGTVNPTTDGWQQIVGTISTPASGKIEEFQLLVQGYPDWANDPGAYDDNVTFLADNLSVKEQVGGVKLVKDALKATPTAIDGIEESAWDTQNKTALTANGDLAASYKALWDADSLYLLTFVQDATKNSSDKVDLYINGDYDKKATYTGPNDRKISVTRSGVTSGATFEAAVKEVQGGYIVECKVPFTDNTLAKGKVVGFDIKVTDNSRVIAWNNQELTQENDKQLLGKLTLSEFTGKLAYVPKGTPNVDITNGIDSVWNTGVELKTEILNAGGTSNKTGTFKVLWDENYLYVLSHVVGDKALNKDNANAWEQDSVEIFKDENNAKTPAYENDDGQFRINYTNDQSPNSKVPVEVTSFTKTEGTNYWVAAKIKWGNVHAINDVLGFDLQLNDTNGTAARTGTLNWSDSTGQGWTSTAGYGCIKLVGAEQPQPDLTVEKLTNVEHFTLGMDAKVRTKVINHAEEVQKAALIVALYDKNNTLLTYGASQQIIDGKKETELEVMMKLPATGEYIVKYFVWDSLEDQNTLTTAGVIPVQ